MTKKNANIGTFEIVEMNGKQVPVPVNDVKQVENNDVNNNNNTNGEAGSVEQPAVVAPPKKKESVKKPTTTVNYPMTLKQETQAKIKSGKLNYMQLLSSDVDYESFEDSLNDTQPTTTTTTAKKSEKSEKKKSTPAPATTTATKKIEKKETTNNTNNNNNNNSKKETTPVAKKPQPKSQPEKKEEVKPKTPKELKQLKKLEEEKILNEAHEKVTKKNGSTPDHGSWLIELMESLVKPGVPSSVYKIIFASLVFILTVSMLALASSGLPNKRTYMIILAVLVVGLGVSLGVFVNEYAKSRTTILKNNNKKATKKTK